MKALLLGFVLVALLAAEMARAADLVSVDGGTFKPLLGKQRLERVAAFLIEQTPVTNADFLNFVRRSPEWRRSRVVRLFADAGYLRHWASDDVLGEAVNSEAPVVHVSWFAARAYCAARGRRLPTVSEWEYLAQFGPRDASKDVKAVILEWYSRPNPKQLARVKSTFQNRFGVWDVHGLIWEWNSDFNTTFVTGESRGDSALEKSMFCGSGAIGSADPSDYAAYMRFGFRSSLKANYTLENLGFRCVGEVR